MTQSQPDDPTADVRVDRLNTLMFSLRGHGFTAEMDEDLLRVSSPDRPGYEIQVRCAHRASDAGRLWFIADGHQALAEADAFTSALMAIKGIAAVRM